MSQLEFISREPLALKDPTLELKLSGEASSTWERFNFYDVNLIRPPAIDIFEKASVRGQWDIGPIGVANVSHHVAEFYWFLAENDVAIENVMMMSAMGKGDVDIGFRIKKNSVTFEKFSQWHSTLRDDKAGIQFGNKNKPTDSWVVSYSDRMPTTSLGVRGVYTAIEWAIWKFIKTGCIGKIWETSKEFHCEEEGDAIVLADFLDTLGLLKEPKDRYARQIGSLRVSPAWAKEIKKTHYAPSIPIAEQK